MTADLCKQSDRAKAIILAAEIDYLLLKILKKHLIPRKKITKNDIDLFATSGPLGSFAARIELSYRLGITLKIICHDLQIIRRIRNKFAHEPHGFSFENDFIKQLVRNFKMPKLCDKKGRKVFSINPENPKQSFEYMAFTLHGHLTGIYERILPVTTERLYTGDI